MKVTNVQKNVMVVFEGYQHHHQNDFIPVSVKVVSDK